MNKLSPNSHLSKIDFFSVFPQCWSSDTSELALKWTVLSKSISKIPVTRGAKSWAGICIHFGSFFVVSGDNGRYSRTSTGWFPLLI